ncbi:caspase family protein [Streptomyces sp. NPDC048636]|uniref:VMAP-C domain-containing protein n=1 Tax=Streptomyces sp. NPDC048636 TaxID=3155762 RepID=UPI003412EA54
MTEAGHDWRRTHAVIVAVEQYRGSDDWTLDGPVKDAIGMRSWLTGLGVPPANIRLLASPKEENRAALADADPGYRAADSGTVRQVFMDELRRIDGDWLWIYWAGHGVQAPGGRWSLLYPETRDTDMRGLNAHNLMSLLRTEHLPRRGVDRVTVVTDACWRALPAHAHELAATPEDLTRHREINHAREISWMRACQSGAVAKNQQGAGVFTAVLLEQLAAASDGGTAPDLGRVWQGVQDEFLRRHGEEGLRQYPTVHLSDGRGNDSETTLGPPAAPRPSLDERGWRARGTLAAAAAGLLAAEPGRAARVLVRLSEEFTAAPPATTSPSAEELVDWALGEHHGTATLLAALAGEAPGEPVPAPAHAASLVLQPGRWLLRTEYDGLVGLLDGLTPRQLDGLADAARAELPGVWLPPPAPAPLADALEELLCAPHQLPQLLRTVERFAAGAEPEPRAETAETGTAPVETAQALRAWSLGCAVRIGLEGALRDRRAEAEERAAAARSAGPVDERVQIRLHPPGPGQRRAYEVWARRGDRVDSLAKVDTPAPLEEIQRGVDELLRGCARSQETVVEFFVAAADLELDVHCWQLTTPFARSLGTDFPVVVRCSEFRAEQRHLWLRRWRAVEAASTDDLYRLPAHLVRSTNVYGDLQAREDVPGVVLTTPARARAEVFTACLFGGVPVLVWHGAPERAGAEAELEALLGTEKLRSLPQQLRKLRSASDADADPDHPGRHLALLWDDPHRPLPGPLDLSAP